MVTYRMIMPEGPVKLMPKFRPTSAEAIHAKEAIRPITTPALVQGHPVKTFGRGDRASQTPPKPRIRAMTAVHFGSPVSP